MSAKTRCAILVVVLAGGLAASPAVFAQAAPDAMAPGMTMQGDGMKQDDMMPGGADMPGGGMNDMMSMMAMMTEMMGACTKMMQAMTPGETPAAPATPS